MIDFANILEQCRVTFRNQQRAWRRDPIGADPLQDLADLAPSFDAVLPHYRKLFVEGSVVWGAVVQANTDCYHPGDTDLPANVVLSPSEAFDDNPGFLRTIARRLLGLKNTKPLDPDLELMASMITDEHNNASNEPVHDKIAGGHEVYLTGSVMHRACFPDGMLGDMIFPMIVCPERTFVNLVLPSSYWPREALDLYGEIEDAALKNYSFPEVKEPSTPRWPTDPNALRPESLITDQLVALTPRAAERLRAIASEEGHGDFVVRASVEPGPRFALSLEDEFDTRYDAVITSQGIQVVISSMDVPSLTGTVIDYRSGPQGTGFAFHQTRPNNKVG